MTTSETLKAPFVDRNPTFEVFSSHAGTPVRTFQQSHADAMLVNSVYHLQGVQLRVPHSRKVTQQQNSTLVSTELTLIARTQLMK
jgi:hypothetical protein